VTSAFFGLDLATRALRSDQTLVDVTNQNIANASTPGYSRQTANLQASTPWPVPVLNASGVAGQMGTGVAVSSITRTRDTFLDSQIRVQMTKQGRWNTLQNVLSNVESIVNEPSDTSVGSQLTNYFNAWQSVANSPSDPSARANLIQNATALATGFNYTVNQLTLQQQQQDQQVGLTVANINDYASQIANINKQIGMISMSGMQPNDLMDQRDQLIDKLSSMVNLSAVQNPDGETSIYVNGQQLVDRDRTTQMVVVTQQGDKYSSVAWAQPGLTSGQLVAPGSVQLVNPTDGQLKGELDARDTVLQGQIDSVNALASRVINDVNTLHKSGTDLNGNQGGNFFDGTDAASMVVDSRLTGDNGTDYVAAAQSYMTSAGAPDWASGDGTNAIAIANLANSLAQVDPSSQLQAGWTSAGGVSVTGVGLSGASPNTTYKFSWDSTNNVLNMTGPSGAPTPVTASLIPGTNTMTVDGQGVRLTLNVPAGTTNLSTVLANLDGTSVTTAAYPSNIGGQYAQFVASVGVDSQTAQGQTANQGVLVNHLEQQRESVSGVSLDEEATNLIQFQRSYEAAARVIATMDSMLDTLINHTGAS
jgi:flagellar hook-associated protein 1 FlgK